MRGDKTMSRFGQKKEDTLLYKNTKLEKKNEELVNRINNELIPALKELTQDNGMLNRLAVRALAELGGSIDITEEEFDHISGRILTRMNEKDRSVTFMLEPKTEVKSDGQGGSEANG
jgi:hypothetical protein